ncbi:imidazole glycerol phosphate synthase subunit HisH [Chryseomicrobium sp. FSL W7-1435]|uniref:imidazole glycerol phosphate synthase subunit HisH n=1 Tax=Chryseomicrobium sp. FSL W7-1435 TaxID=2921704 RepID=UPI003159F55C
MIGILDYGAGNMHSVEKAIKKLGYPYIRIEDGTSTDSVDQLILPGVGHAKQAMLQLEERGLIPYIQRKVEEGIPLLGICLGMQLLLEKSDEGDVEGLGLLQGIVPYFDDSKLKVPHMGWNEVEDAKGHFLLKDLPQNTDFYFVHSYFAAPTNKEDIIGITEYGEGFSSAIGNDFVMGVQFHPEKSGEAGMKLLDNFCRYAKKKVPTC